MLNMTGLPYGKGLMIKSDILEGVWSPRGRKEERRRATWNCCVGWDVQRISHSLQCVRESGRGLESLTSTEHTLFYIWPLKRGPFELGTVTNTPDSIWEKDSVLTQWSESRDRGNLPMRSVGAEYIQSGLSLCLRKSTKVGITQRKFYHCSRKYRN